MSLVLVDLATVYYRAFYSLPDTFVAPSGMPVNAIRGTLDALMHFSRQYKPENLVTCWDFDWRPDWRVDLIESYKTARVAADDEEQMPDTLGPQVDLIWEILEDLGVPSVGLNDYESDDIIAHFARRGISPTYIVTGDRDLFQLIDDERNISILYIGTGISKHTVADNKYIYERFGIFASQYADYSIMRGDASDGLPGVRGIGEKTAANLLKEFGNLENILQAAIDNHPNIKPKIKDSLIEHETYIAAARKVVVLNHELDLDLPEIDWSSARKSSTLSDLGLDKYNELWLKNAKKIAD